MFIEHKHVCRPIIDQRPTYKLVETVSKSIRIPDIGPTTYPNVKINFWWNIHDIPTSQKHTDEQLPYVFTALYLGLIQSSQG